jgi:hypothetical protein
MQTLLSNFKRSGRWAAAMLICFAAAANAQVSVIINEIDSDTPGTDAAEFVELFGTPNGSLTGLVVVFYNGSNDQSYAAFDLDTFSLNASGFFVLGNTGVSNVGLTFAGNTLQNGQDAVALYTGDATDFPNNTPVTTANLIDAIVYDTSDADDPGLLVLLNASQPQVDENASAASADVSVSRCPNGTGGARNTSTYVVSTPTPGTGNSCPVAVEDRPWSSVKQLYGEATR